MSGGVDSSVAALLLQEQGMEVIGISMKTHDDMREGPTSSESLPSVGGTCCSAYDINDARGVCQKLDIPFYALNFKDEFQEKVIQNFVREYNRGRTPNPCVHCNEQIKFLALLQKAKSLGAYYLATGHYAQKSRDRNGRYHLWRGKDHDKDQSYFLFGLGQEELEHSLFPIGKYTKDEVREFARSAGLKTADKPESQEICFVPDNDYAGLIEKKFPEFAGRPGEFIDPAGESLGEHQGVHAYTIGQRRGLGVATGSRVYVTDIQTEENKIVLGEKKDLLKNGLVATGVRWVNREAVTTGAEVEARLRHRHKGVSGVLTLVDETTIHLDFTTPEGPVTPGQAAVLYLGDEVLGGGWIEKGL